MVSRCCCCCCLLIEAALSQVTVKGGTLVIQSASQIRGARNTENACFVIRANSESGLCSCCNKYLISRLCICLESFKNLTDGNQKRDKKKKEKEEEKEQQQLNP